MATPLTIDDYLRRSLLASVYDVARETPLERLPVLSRKLGGDLYLKREDAQPVFSFKLRGAYNKMARLSDADLKKGVVTASAGNHAQGVGLAARHLKTTAVIVMPQTTPSIKVESVAALGAEVVLFGDNYDQASEHAAKLAEERGLTFVHPYDDPDVIAGQGTVGIELLRQLQGPIDAIFVPVGGGGLVSGIGAVVKALRPDVKVVSVEPEDAASMAAALEAGHRVSLDHVGRFADGVAVRKVGEETFRVAQKVVDRCITVSNDEICAAIKDIFEDRRAVLEPAGALAFAGLKKYLAKRGPGVYAAIASGANINFDSLRHVSERAEIGERREVVLAVTIPERPGSFREFCRCVGERVVTEFNYRYAGPQEAHVFVGLRTSQGDAIVASLRESGFEVLDLTDNENAKLHIRHMVGGRADVSDERLIAFGFPERSGALVQFLDAMQHPWNISLFHYRNHGSDIGRVLAGIQVPDAELGQFREFLDRLGYEHEDVTNDPSCKMFLRSPAEGTPSNHPVS
ncbi:MAG TPA: threonine ammonia-lyase, biosynthetic [Fimbriimonas sp.]|nr:threonine ammonia-lyase, biosynthetic [Fimbriimonas sp.]